MDGGYRGRGIEIRGNRERPSGGRELVPARSKPSLNLDEVMGDFEEAIDGVVKGKGGKRPKLDPEALKQLAIFRETFRGLRQSAGAEGDDFRSDLATKAMLRAMLAQVLELIPIAAEKYIHEKNESAAYAFNALANQAKDINIQLRSLDTLEEQAEHVVVKIMKPAFILASQNLLNGWMATKPVIDNFQLSSRQTVRLKETVDGLVREHGKYLDQLMEDANAKIKAFLLGEDPTGSAPKKIKKK